MYDAQEYVVLAMALAALLGVGGRCVTPRAPFAEEEDRVLCAAAMVQAACFGSARHMPRAVRSGAIRGILSLDSASVENALGGRRALRSGLRRYLRLAAVSVAGYREAAILDAVTDYVQAARRLRAPRGAVERAALFAALRTAADLDDAGRSAKLAELARSLSSRVLGARRRVSRDDDAALAWLFGVRAAWLWCTVGGGRSPFFRVSRRTLATARMMLDPRGGGWV